jgi:hypothetical protein
MEKHFKTQQDFLSAVREALNSDGDHPDLHAAIVDGVGQADDRLAEWKEQDNAGQDLRLGRWFIRSDDFPFIQLLGSVAAAVVALAASGGVQAASLVSPITAFAAACWQMRRKGATLTDEQLAVLGVLSTSQGIGVQAIAEKLASTGRKTTGRKVLETLHSLLGLELYDGTVVALVRPEGDNWKAQRV